MEDDELYHVASNLPEGYHNALVTAITVFLGFSLYLIRWWGLENQDKWTPRGVAVTVVLGVGIMAQFFTLFRSLRLADSNRKSYSITVLCFVVAVLITITGVIAAIIVAA